MATSNDDSSGAARARSCADCGAALGGDQRYCLECGARRGALPPAIAARLSELLRRSGFTAAKTGGPSAADAGEGADEKDAEKGAAPGLSFMPSPRVAAVAVMGMLVFGVMLGSAISPLARSAGLTSILLEVSSPPPEEEPVETASVPPPETEAEPALPAEASSVPFVPPPEEAPAAEPPPELPPELPEEEVLPPVKHVFMIVLGENGYEESFGATSTAPYLSKTLPEQGELLPNYYAVTKGDLANQIALLSGQGPTAETAANCPTYADIVPGTLATTGQVEGAGCVYPATTPTLPGQLVKKKLKWKAYVEDIGNGATVGAPATCRHPALGGPDASPVPVPGDAFVTWRNPFVYFHSIVDGAECASTDVGLDQLAPDLAKKATKVPTLSYIVPNACHDGGEVPCEPGQPAGPLAAEAFLQTVVPEIEASPAYKEGGLIAITSAQAPQAGPKPDPSSCCASPAYPNLPPEPPAEPGVGGVKPSGGGGRVGLLLISPFVAAGSVNETGYFNHYSLLFSIEELFGLERIGYATEEALTPFDSTVYNAEETPPVPTLPKKGAKRSRSLQDLVKAPTH